MILNLTVHRKPKGERESPCLWRAVAPGTERSVLSSWIACSSPSILFARTWFHLHCWLVDICLKLYSLTSGYRMNWKSQVAWNLLFGRELVWGELFFFSLIKKKVVNKKREIYTDINLDKEDLHWAFDVCILFRDTQLSACPSTHTVPYSVWTWVSWGAHWSCHISKRWWNTWYVLLLRRC